MMTTDEQGPDSVMPSPCYTIDQVAQRIGITKRTLRYYEEVGLLPPTDRTEGNYRRYSEDDIRLLLRIKELRDLMGFSLNDIREVLDAENERGQIKLAYQQETEAVAKLAQLDRADELIKGQIQLIEQKIAGLEQMRSSLAAKLLHHQQKRQKIYDSLANDSENE